LAPPRGRSSRSGGHPSRCCRENQLVGLPTVARVCPDRRCIRRALDRRLSTIGHSPTGDLVETFLEPLAILATNSASAYFWAGHADAIGQEREVQLRSAYRHGQGRTRDRREAWSAGRDRAGRRGVSTFEDDRIGTPGDDGCSRSADVGRWNGQRGRDTSIGRHVKRSGQRSR
jgi:hypothetical protein